MSTDFEKCLFINCPILVNSVTVAGHYFSTEQYCRIFLVKPDAFSLTK